VRPFVRLLLITILALAVGFFAGIRAAASMAPSHHRWMPPPLPANLALYEPPQSSSGASTPAAAPDTGVDLPPPANGGKAGDGQGRQPLISGRASWHATGRDGLFAAAGPALRSALGPGWRGAKVSVCRMDGFCLSITLNDFCRCDTAEPYKLLDLSIQAFRLFDPRGGNGTTDPGVIEVEVRP
jgi:hypothetical protein